MENSKGLPLPLSLPLSLVAGSSGGRMMLLILENHQCHKEENEINNCNFDEGYKVTIYEGWKYYLKNALFDSIISSLLIKRIKRRGREEGRGGEREREKRKWLNGVFNSEIPLGLKSFPESLIKYVLIQSKLRSCYYLFIFLFF